MGRFAKQLLIGSVFLILVGSLGYGAYDLLTPDPTCFDGIQNQEEDGVDCGTVCGVLCGAALEPLIVGEPQMFDAGEAIDVLVQLQNDNTVYGAARIDYRLAVLDTAGNEQTSRRGATYVNPLETRYLVMTFPGITPRGTGLRFEYDPQKVQWFQGRLPETQVIDFSVMNEALTVSEDGQASYTADVRNDSTFDFEEVDVTVLLFDASGQQVAVGATVVRTLAAGQVRAFTVVWPFAIVGTPIRAQAQVSTNAFNNANFIRTYGGQERFQQF